MSKHLFLVHGRNFKPSEDALKRNWLEAIRHGLERDEHHESLTDYENMSPTFVYYGELSNSFLESEDNPYDEEQDIADRNDCLEELKKYDRDAFLGEKGEERYLALGGASSVKETLADIFADIAHHCGVAAPLMRMVAEDVDHYWEPDTAFGSDVRWKLTEPLSKALENGDDILLVAHSLGTMISYDVLWKFSHYGEYKNLRDAVSKGPNSKPVTLVTLGSPLANETVKKHLKGSAANGNRRYPTLVRKWENFAAWDDFISHDESIEDDYRKMKRGGAVESITDHRIYNLAVRNGTSNPHHGVGYLVHPKFIEILDDWLRG